MGQNGFIFPKFRGENKDSFWGVGLYYTVDGRNPAPLDLSQVLYILSVVGNGISEPINIITFGGFATMVFFSPKNPVFVMFIWGFPKMVVPNNHGGFLLKMIILGCVGGTTI